jgi:selenocysteine-specific elongation factor
MSLLRAFHASNPLEPGASLQWVRAQLGTSIPLADAVVSDAVANGAVEAEVGLVRVHGWQPSLSRSAEALRGRLSGLLAEAGREPPGAAELAAIHGPEVPALLRILERGGVVVLVEGDRYYAADVIQSIVADLRASMEPGRMYSPAELRDLLGVSRKYLIPLLEYCDRTGVTDRLQAGRKLAGTPLAAG